ncbi:type II toxin-antitoxin system Phd/YefM family antitoxin [Granulicella cerasi]|uniref:Type II toxin-antitoxin system Phd/YefM family antitoxin n=1 Tax=Granulicella cerasi TaxID=741063 RepID=A0ABW1ZD08_9BACT|nr:type II toxin-antitoxin system Phd/YefM family antitoxin [Granulicella cerasi]
MANISIALEDIRPLTDFTRNTKAHITRLHKTKSPLVLTVNGSASVVVQDAETFQAQQDRLELLEEERRFVAAVNEGLTAVREGRTRPVREAFDEMEKKLGIRR